VVELVRPTANCQNRSPTSTMMEGGTTERAYGSGGMLWRMSHLLNDSRKH